MARDMQDPSNWFLSRQEAERWLEHPLPYGHPAGQPLEQVVLRLLRDAYPNHDVALVVRGDPCYSILPFDPAEDANLVDVAREVAETASWRLVIEVDHRDVTATLLDYADPGHLPEDVGLVEEAIGKGEAHTLRLSEIAELIRRSIPEIREMS